MSCWSSFWIGLGAGASGLVAAVILLLLIGVMVGRR